MKTFRKAWRRHKLAAERASYLWNMGVPADTAFHYFTYARRPHRAITAPSQAAFLAQVGRLHFTKEWFVGNIPSWEHIFEQTGLGRDAPLKALEIGSWEGMSSLYLLTRFPALHLTCVDTWAGADEHQNAANGQLLEIEARFDHNIASVSDRVTKFRGTSAAYFNLVPAAESFDFVYIDGSHYANDVIIDAVSAFDRLKPGGVMIFDDMMWTFYREDRNNPASAIGAFLRMKKGNFTVVNVGYQLAIRKTRALDRSIKPGVLA